MRGSIRAVHDVVDAFDDGGWWEGRVTEVLKARYKVQPLVSSHVLSVKKGDIRSGVVWDQNQWRLRQPREWKVAPPAGEYCFCCKLSAPPLPHSVFVSR